MAEAIEATIIRCVGERDLVDPRFNVVRSYTDAAEVAEVARALGPTTLWRYETAHVSLSGRGRTPHADAYLGYFLRQKMQPQALLVWAAQAGSVQLVHEAMMTGQASLAAVDFLPLRWAIVNNHTDVVQYLVIAHDTGDIDIDRSTIRGVLNYNLPDMMGLLNWLTESSFPRPYPLGRDYDTVERYIKQLMPE
jgi:hypothetical protein